MKRPGSPDSLGDLMPICPPSDHEQSPRNKQAYNREFESMIDGLEEEAYMEETGHHIPEKKRRLSVVQVKALEKNFEVENKLEPERKLKLAQELGLQPRQVAVWFQNRRARWKTKQLERDYGVLKSSFDSLQDNFESLQQQNEALLQQIRELKLKINGEKETETETETESFPSIKREEEVALAIGSPVLIETPAMVLYDGGGLECKDGPSESDSSAILNEGNSPNAAAQLALNYGATSAPSVDQFVKMEEHDFFSEEACNNFFSEPQAPTLHWWA